MAGDEQVLAHGSWAGIAPLAIRNLVWAIAIAVVFAVAVGSIGGALLAAAIYLALSFGIDSFGWRQLRRPAYTVVDGALVVRGRRWSQAYPLAEIERAEVIGAATWRRTVLRLGASLTPAYPLVRLEVRGQPVWGPQVAIWGRKGAAALQERLDAVLAARRRT